MPERDTSTPRLSPEHLPSYADRVTLARIITDHFFPVSARTLRTWPLVAYRPNKRVVYNVDDALAYAAHKLETAPCYKQNGVNHDDA